LFPNLFPNPASPTNPEARRSMVAGSVMAKRAVRESLDSDKPMNQSSSSSISQGKDVLFLTPIVISSELLKPRLSVTVNVKVKVSSVSPMYGAMNVVLTDDEFVRVTSGPDI
jgi:hypothetical protein